MTDFTNLATLVGQGQALLDQIKGGKLAEIDASFIEKLASVDEQLSAKIAQANADIAAATAPINNKVPLIQLSKNQELMISSGTVPDDLLLNGSVQSQLVTTIQASAQSSEQSTLLAQIEADVQTQFADFNIRNNDNYVSDFNIIKLTWDYGPSFSGAKYLAIIRAITGLFSQSSEFTAASLVKLESGTVVGGYASNAILGKWQFCSQLYTNPGFGSHINTFPFATSQTGSLMFALPVVTTGNIDHPNKLFKNTEL